MLLTLTTVYLEYLRLLSAAWLRIVISLCLVAGVFALAYLVHLASPHGLLEAPARSSDISLQTGLATGRLNEINVTASVFAFLGLNSAVKLDPSDGSGSAALPRLVVTGQRMTVDQKLAYDQEMNVNTLAIAW